MILVVDSSALALLINPEANPPNDPKTNGPVEFASERVHHFISGLTANDTLIIPTPVLAEVLVKAQDGAPDVLEQLSGLARMRVRPFDQRAAVETALMTRQALQEGDKRSGSSAHWQKVKFDRQIVAIARTNSATKIYADDANLINFAKRLGIDVISTWDLPVPQREENLFTAVGLFADGGAAAPNVAPHTDMRPTRAINLDDPTSKEQN